MRIGKEKDYHDKEMQLLNWSGSWGSGISGITDPSELPDNIFDFCASQYQRFNMPIPPKDVIVKGVWGTFCTIDYFDPYVWFYGDSDVELTDDSMLRAYKVNDEDLDPEFFETYKLVHDNDIKFFEFELNREDPGLHNIGCGFTIEDNLFGDYSSDHIQVSDESYRWIKDNSPAETEMPEEPAVLKGNDWVSRYNRAKDLAQSGNTNLDPDEVELINSVNNMMKNKECADFILAGHRLRKTNKFREDYFKIAAWAAYLWFMGPLGRKFRDVHYDIFNICYDHGECILDNGVFYNPTNYTVSNRPPSSCEICGLDSYCVELSFFDGGAKYICEHHLSGHLPKFTQASCGTRTCKYVECHFHPMYGIEDARRLAYKTAGQLTKKVQENQVLLEGKNQHRPQLLS